ncbi:MAG: RluA family pseudouridine synthase [Candidatus Saccharibacteria bacterium]
MKVSSRDILDILRRYELAGDENVPRHIETVKISNPSPINTMVAFRFNRQQFYILFDASAEDDVNYVISQIRAKKNSIKGELLKNPRDSVTTYAMPFKGKECYLFKVISDKKRLDVELAERYPETSRSTWQKYIRAGQVSINGIVITSPKQDITENDQIAIVSPDVLDFSKHELPIIYIDDNIIVINKPNGVLSHSKGVLNDEFTVADFFRRYTTYNIDTNRPGIIHRLDRDTSGVMIGARNQETAVLLQKQFADRKTKKTYYAVLNGIPRLDKANIDLPIGRNPSAPSTFRVDSKGKSAVTKYEVIATNNKHSLVKLQPQTGRTHQLRVHMKYLNTPILGDKVYGKPAERLFLHAQSIEITIPGGNRQTFTVPIPQDFIDYFPGVSV